MSEESGWLIERGDSDGSRPNYWIGFSGNKSLWSFDNLEAVRFSRKEDALRVRTSIESSHYTEGTHRVTEHGWG